MRAASTIAVALVIAASAAAGVPASAQTAAKGETPTASQPSASSAAPANPAPLPPPSSESYAYEPEGRRDPFVSLLGTGTEPSGKRGEGAAGLSVGELSVRGVLESKGMLIAMVEGPDKKTYVVHQGDKLLDGTIRSITSQGLVIVQEVNDPLSLVKQREIRKLLRSLESAKE
jgi:type IV pilus assembly protein PilP